MWRWLSVWGLMKLFSIDECTFELTLCKCSFHYILLTYNFFSRWVTMMKLPKIRKLLKLMIHILILLLSTLLYSSFLISVNWRKLCQSLRVAKSMRNFDTTKTIFFDGLTEYFCYIFDIIGKNLTWKIPFSWTSVLFGDDQQKKGTMWIQHIIINGCITINRNK